MNWKYVKLLLILLLIGVNILLGTLIYDSYSNSAFTDVETAQKVSDILEKGGIYADSSLLAVKNDTARDYTSPFDREEYLLSAAAFLLGGTPDGVFLLPDGIRAEKDGKTALLYSDMRLRFAAEGISEDTIHPRPITDEEKAQTVREEFASILGYDADDLRGITMLEQDGMYVMTLSQKEAGIPLFGYECTFASRNGEVVYADGRHFFGTFKESSEAPLLNRANILLSEKARGESGTVANISLCYVLYEDTLQERIHLAPAYAVTYGDGKTSIIDAQSAKVFE